jgi:hypothetical protein
MAQILGWSADEAGELEVMSLKGRLDQTDPLVRIVSCLSRKALGQLNQLRTDLGILNLYESGKEPQTFVRGGRPR